MLLCYAVARRSCARDADHGSKRMHWPPGPYDGRRPRVRCVRRPPLDHTAAFRHMCRTLSVRSAYSLTPASNPGACYRAARTPFAMEHADQFSNGVFGKRRVHSSPSKRSSVSDDL
jgi:hypothetical protein